MLFAIISIDPSSDACESSGGDRKISGNKAKSSEKNAGKQLSIPHSTRGILSSNASRSYTRVASGVSANLGGDECCMHRTVSNAERIAEFVVRCLALWEYERRELKSTGK